MRQLCAAKCRNFNNLCSLNMCIQNNNVTKTKVKYNKIGTFFCSTGIAAFCLCNRHTTAFYPDPNCGTNGRGRGGGRNMGSETSRVWTKMVSGWNVQKVNRRDETATNRGEQATGEMARNHLDTFSPQRTQFVHSLNCNKLHTVLQTTRAPGGHVKGWNIYVASLVAK